VMHLPILANHRQPRWTLPRHPARRARRGRRSAILGGVLGALATSSASGAGQAVGTAGGVLAGLRLGRLAGTQAVEYTIRISDRETIRTDEAGLRIGDCVAVERGGLNNLRLVNDARCGRTTRPTPGELNSARARMRGEGAVARSAGHEQHVSFRLAQNV